jgi:hypothetical protein
MKFVKICVKYIHMTVHNAYCNPTILLSTQNDVQLTDGTNQKFVLSKLLLNLQDFPFIVKSVYYVLCLS